MTLSMKSPKTIDEQILLLQQRGMLIEDQALARAALQQHNYYRLSGYWYHLYQEPDIFKEGTSFNQVIRLYEFDRELRLLLFEALEKIETFCRAQITYTFSHLHGADGHYNETNFLWQPHYQTFLSYLENQMLNNKDNAFVTHNSSKYGGKMPIWCVAEIISFTKLSMFYNNLHPWDQKRIADDINHEVVCLANWLHCLSVLRNRCAHYSRLYNRTLSPPIRIGPRTMKKYPEIKNDSLFAYVIVISRILPTAADAETFLKCLIKIVSVWSSYLHLPAIGFPQNWETLLNTKKVIGRLDLSPNTSTPLIP